MMSSSVTYGYILLSLYFMYGYGITLSAAQHYNYLRPEPTNEMPIPKIIENQDPTLDPPVSEINASKLKRKLGNHYKPEYMSLFPPPSIRSEPTLPLNKRLPMELRKVVKRMQKKPIRSRKKQMKMFNQLIEKTTSCPLRYRWKNMGVRFWPPYVKESYCDTTQSCSIPPGMNCKAAAYKNLTFLRWHCQGISSEMKYCLWIEVQIPSVARCECGC